MATTPFDTWLEDMSQRVEKINKKGFPEAVKSVFIDRAITPVGLYTPAKEKTEKPESITEIVSKYDLEIDGQDVRIKKKLDSKKEFAELCAAMEEHGYMYVTGQSYFRRA